MGFQRSGWVCAGLVLAMVGACGGKTDVPPVPPAWTPILLRAGTVDKVDLLFAIDNSASMADKQALFAQAIPDLVGRLITPRCVPPTAVTCATNTDCSALGSEATCDTALGSCYVPGTSSCPMGTTPEFAPVHDLHIGIVTSSLGGGGSPDICVPADQNDATHVDDHGHLINRTLGPPEGVVSNAKPVSGNGGNFLAWLPLPSEDAKNANKPDPNVTKYTGTHATQLETDFASLVVGSGEHGCGLEAQLESWYRFLIQPDPYNAITLNSDSPPAAQLHDVDATLLAMRHDFLRPDSLVGIIQLTDEEDSWSDPLWLGGYGWTVRTLDFPGGPTSSGLGPRGTSECDAPVDINNVSDTGPNNPDCQSCAFPLSTKPVSGQPIGSDPNCKSCADGVSGCQPGWYTGTQDGLNVRYTNDMKRRYGLDPQWNIQRYVDGLRLPTAPDRDNEVHDSANYGSTKRNCQNPLFAGTLPDGSDTTPNALCNLQPGPRTPDLVFYALIGGIARSLVHTSLSPDDWTRIVGKDPGTYQSDGIAPYMIESIQPRAGLQGPSNSYTLGTDPNNGREWNTLTSLAGIDLQYACIFDLPEPRDCSSPQFANACDCVSTAITTADGPPLCDPKNRNMQIRGKAYPTIRELRVAQGLGTQSVVASICAADTELANIALPSYGYRPAMTAIANRFSSAMSAQCLPNALPLAADGSVACTLLVVDSSRSDQAAACTDPGLTQPPAGALQQFDSQYPSGPAPVACALTQLTSCVDSGPAGWCYVTTADCAQSIHFSALGEPKPGMSVVLECPPH